MFAISASLIGWFSGADGAEQGSGSLAWWRKAKGQRDNYCRPCRAEYKQEHDAVNRQRYIDNAQKRKQVMLRVRTTYLLDFFKTHPCADCGEADPIVLEFDHLSDKLFSISRGVRDRSWDAVLREMAKCDVVCATVIAVGPRAGVVISVRV